MQIKENGIITFTREITWLTFVATGWGNGYIGLPEGHPLYGKGYDDVPVEVNGGLTFGQEEEIDGIKYWVFGFDCCHVWDTPEKHNEAFVIAETESMYNQIISL